MAEKDTPQAAFANVVDPESDRRDDEDVLIADWDGPDDPQNPQNWSFKRKWIVTSTVSAFTFISPVSSAMIAPASDVLVADFDVAHSASIVFNTSVFILAYVLGTLLLGPLSELHGRSRVLLAANMWYLFWNFVCGLAQNEGQLIALRFLAGLGGSAPLSIGGGVLGDCWRPEERGQVVALYSLPPLFVPVIGPVVGAWIVERSAWRWVFWSTTIVDSFILIFGFFFLQETFAPLLLERKAAHMRKRFVRADEYGKGRIPLRTIKTRFEVVDAGRTWQRIFAKARPFTLSAREPLLQVLDLNMTFIYVMALVAGDFRPKNAGESSVRAARN